MREAGIYKINCILTNKTYVGYSVNLKRREKEYIKLNIPNQIILKESIQIYGWENHKFEIIEYCDIQFLKERERFWIEYFDSFKNGLNGNRGGGGPLIHSKETRLKISKKSKLNKGKRINSHWKGQKLSDEHILNNKNNKGKRINSHWKGKKRSEENCIKLSKSKKNKPNLLNAKSIIQYDLNGKIINEFDSIEKASKQLNINPTGISNCLIKIKQGKKATSGGYIWKYKI